VAFGQPAAGGDGLGESISELVASAGALGSAALGVNGVTEVAAPDVTRVLVWSVVVTVSTVLTLTVVVLASLAVPAAPPPAVLVVVVARLVEGAGPGVVVVATGVPAVASAVPAVVAGVMAVAGAPAVVAAVPVPVDGFPAEAGGVGVEVDEPAAVAPPLFAEVLLPFPSVWGVAVVADGEVPATAGESDEGMTFATAEPATAALLPDGVTAGAAPTAAPALLDAAGLLGAAFIGVLRFGRLGLPAGLLSSQPGSAYEEVMLGAARGVEMICAGCGTGSEGG
jgi:hypothetical protein